MKTKILLGILTGALISGCSFKPVTPQKQINFKADYAQMQISPKWWRNFNDENLNSLVVSALEKNSDLNLALNNIEIARSNLGLTQLDYLPNISLQGSALRQNNFPTTPDANSHGVFSIASILSYEVDLWGRVRNAVGAGGANFMANVYDYETAKNTITSTVATTYFTILSLAKQEQILNTTLKSYVDTQNFRKRQLDSGVISQIDYAQSVAMVQNAKTSLVSIQNSLSQANTALNILTGKSYNEIANGAKIYSANLPKAPQIPQGIPSDVLLHRPDVASAIERLRASNFLVGVAKAGYFPTFSLTGNLGYASGEFDRLLTSSASVWSIGGSLIGPLLDFGRTKKRVEIANLEQNASFINYDKTLKVALGDVRDALNSVKNAKASQNAIKELVASYNKIFNMANERYNEGYSDHLELLDAQRNLLSSKLALANADLALLTATVEAYKALGGGFSISDDEVRKILGANSDVEPTNSTLPIDERLR